MRKRGKVPVKENGVSKDVAKGAPLPKIVLDLSTTAKNLLRQHFASENNGRRVLDASGIFKRIQKDDRLRAHFGESTVERHNRINFVPKYSDGSKIFAADQFLAMIYRL